MPYHKFKLYQKCNKGCSKAASYYIQAFFSFLKIASRTSYVSSLQNVGEIDLLLHRIKLFVLYRRYGHIRWIIGADTRSTLTMSNIAFFIQKSSFQKLILDTMEKNTETFIRFCQIF